MYQKIQNYILMLLLTVSSLSLAATETMLFNRNKFEQATKQSDKFKQLFRQLEKSANLALNAGPFSVVYDELIPPSGDKHDYMSLAKYWWPDPENPEAPWERKDGVTNPLANAGDKAARKGMYQSVEVLSLAYYIFHNKQYAEKAAELIRVWFIDDSTRMAPHMNFGQSVPGRNTGRQFGIIETRPFILVADAVTLLNNSSFLTEKEQLQLENWFKSYLDWLLNSDFGQKEANNGNNHQTAHLLQVVSYALFTNQEELARSLLTERMPDILDMIEPDGKQPREIARTKGLHYSCMNLSLMFHLCDIAKQFDLEYFNAIGEKGGSVKKAFELLLPYIENPESWPFQQIEKSPPDYDEVLYILRTASREYPGKDYERIIQSRYSGKLKTHIGQLYWPQRFNTEK